MPGDEMLRILTCLEEQGLIRAEKDLNGLTCYFPSRQSNSEQRWLLCVFPAPLRQANATGSVPRNAGALHYN